MLIRRKTLKLAACLLTVTFIIQIFVRTDLFNNTTSYSVDSNLILEALQYAKNREIDLEKQYELTAIIVSWNRLYRVKQLTEYYLSTKLCKDILIWNNNPQVHLTMELLQINNLSSNSIRIVNSKKNVKDEAKYRACTEARTRACFYAGEKWDPSAYMKSLVSSFRSDPHVLHSTTNVVTYYNNLLWTFMDSRIDLHTSFSWVDCGSVFLRDHARQHLQLLTTYFLDTPELFAFSDIYFSVWLNDIPSQLIVNLRTREESVSETDEPFPLTPDIHDTSSIFAIRKLDYVLRVNQSTNGIDFPRQQTRRFPYCVKSPSLNDDFTFYSNVLPVDIEHTPFDVIIDFDRATYKNVPKGENYLHFSTFNTMKAVDDDYQTCWHPKTNVRKGDFFAIDLLRIQTNLVLTFHLKHSQQLQNSLDARVSFDGTWWISHRLAKGVFVDTGKLFTDDSLKLVVDTRHFPLELQSFRYIVFNATHHFDEVFQVCDVKITNYSPIL